LFWHRVGLRRRVGAGGRALSLSVGRGLARIVIRGLGFPWSELAVLDAQSSNSHDVEG